jgi:hypothetical protein
MGKISLTRRGEKSAHSRGDLFPPDHAASEVEFLLIHRRSASTRWRLHSARNFFALETAALLR